VNGKSTSPIYSYLKADSTKENVRWVSALFLEGGIETCSYYEAFE
jgi:hypothetical protein